MDTPQQVTGWKDSKGTFHDTYEKARQSDLTQELRSILVVSNSNYSYSIHNLIEKKDAVVKILLQM